MTWVDGTSEAELDAAYQAYRSAMTTWRGASKAGHPEASDAAADRLLHARVALYKALIGTGWGPPPEVQKQIERDAALIAVPVDELESLLAV